MMSAVEDFRRDEKVRLDVLKRFGYYSTESNGHLSEYLPWYRKRVGEITDWIRPVVLDQRRDRRLPARLHRGPQLVRDRLPELAGAGRRPSSRPENRSEEHGSYIIEALETGRIYRGHFNVVNQGHITNLPDGCIIEIPGYVDRNGINMPVVGDLPLACAATCSASVRVQEMGMEAAVHGDVTLLKQAMLHDPLVGAVCNPEEVWQMTDEMLVAQAAVAAAVRRRRSPAARAAAGRGRGERHARHAARDRGRGARAHQDRRGDGGAAPPRPAPTRRPPTRAR